MELITVTIGNETFGINQNNQFEKINPETILGKKKLFTLIPDEEEVKKAISNSPKKIQQKIHGVPLKSFDIYIGQ